VVAALARGLLAPGGAPGAGADPAEALAELARAAGGAGRHLLLLALRAAACSGALCPGLGAYLWPLRCRRTLAPAAARALHAEARGRPPQLVLRVLHPATPRHASRATCAPSPRLSVCRLTAGASCGAEDAGRRAMAATAAARVVAAVGWSALQADAGSDDLGVPSENAAAADAAAPTPGFDAAGLPMAEHWSALAAAPAAARRAQLRWALLAALQGSDGESAPGTAVLLAAAAGMAAPSERAASQVSSLCWQLGAVFCHSPSLQVSKQSVISFCCR